MSGHAALTRFVEARELLYLSTVDVRDLGVFDFAWAVDRIEQAYRAHYAGDTVMPKTEYLKYSGRSSYDPVREPDQAGRFGRGWRYLIST